MKNDMKKRILDTEWQEAECGPSGLVQPSLY